MCRTLRSCAHDPIRHCTKRGMASNRTYLTCVNLAHRCGYCSKDPMFIARCYRSPNVKLMSATMTDPKQSNTIMRRQETYLPCGIINSCKQVSLHLPVKLGSILQQTGSPLRVRGREAEIARLVQLVQTLRENVQPLRENTPQRNES